MLVFFKMSLSLCITSTSLQLFVTKEHTSHISFDFIVFATRIMLYVFFLCNASVCCIAFKLTFLVCVSQGHKYIVQAEVLYKSWDLDESQLAFVHMLRDLEKNELRGTYSRQLHQTVSQPTLLKGQTEKIVIVYSMICIKYFW